MMGTEILKIDASWAEKLTKTRVSILMTPTVGFCNRGSRVHLEHIMLTTALKVSKVENGV